MRRSLFFLLMLFVCASPLIADGTQLGTITGRVTDQSGAVLPGATVEIVNLEKGISLSKTTDPEGKYIFPLLHPGPYRVTVSLSGFDTVVSQNAIVEVGKTTNINSKLKLSATSETITVQGDVPIVDKTNASQTTTVSSTPANCWWTASGSCPSTKYGL